MMSTREGRERGNASQQKHRQYRSVSEKRKPSGSPTDSIPPKTPKQMVQSTLNMTDVFTLGMSSTPNTTDETNMADTPQAGASENDPPQDKSLNVSYPSSLFNFINEASNDIITTKLINALMKPELQDKFRESFTSVATAVISGLVKDIVAPLQKEIEDLRQELEEKTDELEQYSHRNSVRITGLKEIVDEVPEETVQDILKIVHTKMSVQDIDRCHRVGKKMPGRNRAIIVKFVSYWDRNQVIMNRRKLRGQMNSVYINEDLTQRRSLLYKSARELKKQGRFDGTWTFDGRIYTIDQPEGKIRHIQRNADLDRYRQKN